MNIGYIRVSTAEQNTIRQEVLMEKLGVEKIFLEKVSGKDTTGRPQLKEMMEFVRKGDTVIVESISRFARNTRDLLELVDTLTSKGVEFVSQKEAIDTSTPTGKFMLTVFGAVAELELEYLRQRRQEGIDEAKKQGKYTGRKQMDVDKEEFERLYYDIQNGERTVKYAYTKLEISRSMFYKLEREYTTKTGRWAPKA